ncbi:hypothetical protein BDY21DRAFT_74852 [Lineolata rhizophorae]|uniref:IgE-binding protein n=1 Tax=Lineolata rhizophorae TaxID=578093 RepID=A0A6A6NUD0_9PEZI|nr:hypothetical protein BDY21DRAFT_74852 [Lineolata rhizophorae]
MKPSTILVSLLSALPAAILAAPTSCGSDDSDSGSGVTRFGVMSARSASPIHLLPLNARNGHFYLGGETQSYCPEEQVQNCPAGNETVLAGGDNTLALAVDVPGGQLVYIGPDGAMSFTPAHSASMPEGSVLTGWNYTAGDPFGHLQWFPGGLVACMDRDNQVFGQVEGFNSTGCLGFDALAIATEEVGAWQYT